MPERGRVREGAWQELVGNEGRGRVFGTAFQDKEVET